MPDVEFRFELVGEARVERRDGFLSVSLKPLLWIIGHG
jgi:hypothetical protein